MLMTKRDALETFAVMLAVCGTVTIALIVLAVKIGFVSLG